MKFDIVLPGTNHIPGTFDWAHDLKPDNYRAILGAIDSLGFHAILVSEHIGVPHHEVQRLGAYWQDALSVMAFAAAATTNVRIDSNVLVVPYHHPLKLSKALATIDVLSPSASRRPVQCSLARKLTNTLRGDGRDGPCAFLAR